MSDPIEPFLESLRELVRGRRVVVAAHPNADLDAVASGLLLCEVVRAFEGQCCVAFNGTSKESEESLRALRIDVPLCGTLPSGKSDVLLAVVDSSTRAQVADVLRLFEEPPTIMIDHHEVGDLQDVASLKLVDPMSPSCAELAAELALKAGVAVSKDLATLAVLAILSETSLLSRASARTFNVMARLLEEGADYQWALARLQQAPDEPLEVRMAKVKGASRTVVAKACGDIIVAVTEVGSYEAEVAKGLVALGADVSIVIKGDRASVRLSKRAIARGLSAGSISEAVARSLGGSGGGHRGAAGFKLPAEPSDVDRLKQRVAGIVMNLVNDACGGGGSEL